MNKLRKHFLFYTVFCFFISLNAQKPPITPAWAFKHMAWEDSINTSDGAIALVEGYLKRNIPVGAVIIDSPWSDAYNDFRWDKERYPDYENMINYFKDKNIKVLLWLTGATNFKSKDTKRQKAANYDYAVSKNYGINDSKPGKWWKGEGIHIDFTKEEAKKWWFSELDKVFIDGVYGWKVDQGEFWFGDKVKTSIGTLSNEDFRPYYYDAMYEYTINRNPAGINMSRPYSHQGGFFASVNKLNLGWCGDFSGNWDGLKLQIENIYRTAEKGYGAPGCEIAGFFMERSNKEQFIRYSQFGSMTATMINGGENGAFSNHLPWYHGKDVEDIYRFCVVLHNQLIPYMFSTVVEAHLTGGSLLKNLSFEEESHQIGEDIFTKAISSNNNFVKFTLPINGEWIDFWDNKYYKGGTLITKEYSLDQFPLFFRAGSIIPMNIENSLTGIGDCTMKGKEVILINSGTAKTTKTYHAPIGEGIEYNDIQIEYDSINKRLNVSSKIKNDYIFIFKNVEKTTRINGNISSWRYDKEIKELQVFASDKNITFTMF